MPAAGAGSPFRVKLPTGPLPGFSLDFTASMVSYSSSPSFYGLTRSLGLVDSGRAVQRERIVGRDTVAWKLKAVNVRVVGICVLLVLDRHG